MLTKLKLIIGMAAFARIFYLQNKKGWSICVLEKLFVDRF
jgi:hypothetical protein